MVLQQNFQQKIRPGQSSAQPIVTKKTSRTNSAMALSLKSGCDGSLNDDYGNSDKKGRSVKE
jgi:hypothetical protein